MDKKKKNKISKKMVGGLAAIVLICLTGLYFMIPEKFASSIILFVGCIFPGIIASKFQELIGEIENDK